MSSWLQGRVAGGCEDEEEEEGGRQRWGRILIVVSEAGILLVMDGSSWREKKRERERDYISHGGFEHKHFELGLRSVQLRLIRSTRPRAKAGASRERAAALLQENMDLMAAEY